MILGIPLITAVRFDIGEHLENNFDSLNGQDIGSTETDDGNVKRVNAEALMEDYVPVQIKPHAPLDEEDLLETYSSCLTIGHVDIVEELRYIDEMRQRSYYAISGYRKDATKVTKGRYLKKLKLLLMNL